MGHRETSQKQLYFGAFRDTKSPAFNSDVQYTVSWTDIFDGVGLPGHARIIRNRGNATTPATGFKRLVKDVSTPTAVWKYRDPSIPLEWTKSYDIHVIPQFQVRFTSTPTNPTVDQAAQAENAAREDFYKNLSKAASEFKGGVFLGELQETMHMLRHPCQGLQSLTIDYLNRCSKVRGKTAKAISNALSSLYLEYIYGWKPLVSDISAIASTITKLQKFPPIEKIEGYGRVDYSDSTITGVGTAVTGTGYSYTQRSIYRYDVKYSGAASMDPNNLTARLGGSPEDFIPTVWELIPYSFLVDYFTNVGDLITACQYQTFTPLWVSRTERFMGIMKFDATSTHDSRLVGNDSVFFVSHDPVSAHWESQRIQFSRILPTNIPMPDFRFKLPGWQQWFNTSLVLGLARDITSKISKRG